MDNMFNTIAKSLKIPVERLKVGRCIDDHQVKSVANQISEVFTDDLNRILRHQKWYNTLSSLQKLKLAYEEQQCRVSIRFKEYHEGIKRRDEHNS